MKRLLFLISLILVVSTGISQNTFIANNKNISNFSETEALRIVKDNGINGVYVDYKFPAFSVSTKVEINTTFQMISLKGFSHLKNVGKPALPSHNDLVAIPLGAKCNIEIISSSFITKKNYLIFPALKPAVDTYGADDPEFEIDKEFYKKNILYPELPIEIVEIIQIRGMKIAVVQIRPIQYNPAKNELRIFSELSFKVNFLGGTSFIENEKHSDFFKNIYGNVFLNKQSIKNEIEEYAVNNNSNKSLNESKNYIIITHSEYISAAEKLAQWKRQLGYSVEIVSNSNWSSSTVKNEIQTRYNLWDPKPDYFLIFGDHENVPGQIVSNFATDLYYACMDGASDFTPDMAYGRISVKSVAEAILVVDKIINYEKFPVADPNFYTTALNCAYFQESNTSGYAERRFAQTSEDILNYVSNNTSINVNRVYYTGSNVYPTNWNNGSYSAGEPLPTYLLKPTFPWDGNSTDIINEINNGTLYVLHRDHGFENGWGDPYFDKTDIGNLTNGNLLPVVFSINCLTGKFIEDECFSEKFLRQANGGAVGVFGHAEVSYSGYNDALALGFFDAIWASPGLIPDFTGSGGIPNANYTTHEPIVTMGDVKNYGLLRMTETWDASQTTSELIHYFGDPAMKMWTELPGTISATNDTSIICGTIASISITNCSCLDAIATFVVDDELIEKIQLINGEGILTFDPIAGQLGLLTISKHNFQPYVDTITIIGDCPKAKFYIGESMFCLDDSVSFYDSSTGNISSYEWDFGIDAIPASSNVAGPHNIQYFSSGEKIISLTVIGPGGTDTYLKSINISENCKFYIPMYGTAMSDFCFGKLFDNGGNDNYSNNTNGSFIIMPSGASSIVLNFNSFNFEFDYDTLFIYDGEISMGSLIGAYTGSNLPNGGTIISTYGSITLVQQTDLAVTESGFELDWSCNYPNTPPAPDFIYSIEESCDGIIEFFDISMNAPDEWFWDFGDGNFSTEQNPVHVYNTNGIFDVSLISTNIFGSDTIIKSQIITINRPENPIVEDIAICNEGEATFYATASGTISWYADSLANNFLDTGNIFVSSFLIETTSFYAENTVESPTIHGGKLDNTGGGSIFTASVSHYLVFDCFNPLTLVSVKVYASGSSYRTIELRNANSTVLETATIFIPDGESRIQLNWEIPAGTNYQLAGPVSPLLYRNNNGLNYPYEIANLISIKHSSASSNPTGYYYFFYDWEVHEEDCYSPLSKVTAHIFVNLPTCNFEYSLVDSVVNFSNLSTDCYSVLWNFGDGTFSEIENPVHIFSEGNYTISLIAYNPCGSDSIVKEIEVYIGNNIDEQTNISDILIFPNPAKEQINISFSVGNKQDIEIILENTIGQTVFQKNIKLFSGKFNETIITKNLPKGIYILGINSNRTKSTNKIVIQ